jgi:TolB-like protein/DNA-binding winged helix-turn-helix (wHTH) protein
MGDRVEASSQPRRDVWRVGDLLIDEGQQLVMRGDEVIELPKLSFDLLIALVRSAPDVVSIDTLLTRVWPGVVVSPETVVQRVKMLRDALDDRAAEPRYIMALRMRGYRLVAEVSKAEAPEAFRKTARPAHAPELPSPQLGAAAGPEASQPNRGRGDVTFATAPDMRVAKPRPKWLLPFVAAGAAVLIALVVVINQRFSEPPVKPESATPGAAPISIAVLPFADMSADKNQEYMADGMAEELLNLLSQIPNLRVISRTSSFAFKGQTIELTEIGRRLNVAYVLEGSVRSSSDRLRITAQLVRTADGTHLWSEAFDRPLGDVFAVQDEIAKAVVSKLKIKLLRNAPKTRARKPEAYALFLKARAIGMQHTPSAYQQSISLYEQALKLEPEYAEAWDGLANNYGYQAIDGIRGSAEGFQLASAAAQKALALDPRYAQAHARLGWIAINYDRDLVSAARHLSNALALDPFNTDTIGWSAILLRRLGRLDQAIEIGDYLVIHDPLNADAILELGLAHKYAEHWDTAITHYRSALALSPSAMGGHGVIGEIMLLQGNARAALAEVRLETEPAWRLHVQSLAYHALGQSAASVAALTEMIERHGNNWASFVVEEAAFRGDIDLAFEWLDKAAQLRDPSLGAIPLSPFCANLHKDPRWHPYLRQQGMAPEQLAAINFDITLPQ